jgi:hypothetical protein
VEYERAEISSSKNQEAADADLVSPDLSSGLMAVAG